MYMLYTPYPGIRNEYICFENFNTEGVSFMHQNLHTSESYIIKWVQTNIHMYNCYSVTFTYVNTFFYDVGISEVFDPTELIPSVVP